MVDRPSSCLRLKRFSLYYPNGFFPSQATTKNSQSLSPVVVVIMPPLTTTTAVVNGGIAHIPAWKRIGLKLKYAADTPGIPAVNATLPSKKRKHRDEDNDNDQEDEEAETKKMKKEKKKKISKKERRQQQQQQDETSEPTTTTASKASTPPPQTPQSSRLSISPTKSLLKKPKPTSPTSSSRRKSVTFASDVKETDGDSIKQLYLALDPFGKNRTRGGVTPTVNTPSSKTPESKPNPTTSPPKKHPSSSTKKPKHRGGSNNTGSTKPYLDYLSNFHLHRGLWKFEKAKQNWVLKNALDTELITETHEKALAAYVAGLQGAGARDRLLEEAKKVLKDLQEPRLERAKLIAKALGRKDLTGDESDNDSSSSSSSSTAAAAAPAPKTVIVMIVIEGEGSLWGCSILYSTVFYYSSRLIHENSGTHHPASDISVCISRPNRWELGSTPTMNEETLRHCWVSVLCFPIEPD
ncbi:hypothetical protein K440DRAFT_354866 [Wilcoxina mikolae CBS 423.85]|nr:hypothetical protein K440DRAFT_354866 [Wilcoxina mikolae CBS 423.85]